MRERKRHTARRVASARCPIPGRGGGLLPRPRSGEGGTPPPRPGIGLPPPREMWTDKLKTVPSLILRMRAVNKGGAASKYGLKQKDDRQAKDNDIFVENKENTETFFLNFFF